jgi:hypothetical protein
MLWAQLIYYILLLAAIVNAVAAGIAVKNGVRPRWFALESFGFGLIGIGMGLAVIGFGPNPVVDSIVLRTTISILFFLGGVMWLVWGGFYFSTIVRVKPKEDVDEDEGEK